MIHSGYFHNAAIYQLWGKLLDKGMYEIKRCQLLLKEGIPQKLFRSARIAAFDLFQE